MQCVKSRKIFLDVERILHAFGAGPNEVEQRSRPVVSPPGKLSRERGTRFEFRAEWWNDAVDVSGGLLWVWVTAGGGVGGVGVETGESDVFGDGV